MEDTLMPYENLPRLPDPTTVPEGPGFLTQSIIDNSPGMVHNLNNGGSISVKFAGNYWTINIAYPQLTISEMDTLLPFLYSLQGAFSNFYVQLPIHDNPRAGAWATTPPAGDVSIGSSNNQVEIANWASAISNAGSTLNTGDMLKFTNTNKIYMIVGMSLLADTMTLTLNSEVTDVAAMAAATIEPNDIKFRVRQVGKMPSVLLNADGLYESFSLSLRENIL